MIQHEKNQPRPLTRPQAFQFHFNLPTIAPVGALLTFCRNQNIKPVAWISGSIIAALCAFIVVDGPSGAPKISYAEARRSVDALDGHDGIEFIQTQNWKVAVELGTTLEKRLRELLHLKQRRSSFQIEAHQFRDSTGEFSIKIHDKEREGTDITIYPGAGIMKPSMRTRDHLITLFPHAHLDTDLHDQ